MNSCNVQLQRKLPKSLSLTLVVDDDQDNLFFVSCILDNLKLKHIVSLSGKQAIDLAIEKSPDLILLDMVMPEINGLEITRLLKTNPITSHIPVIAVTGLAFPEQQTAIMAAGCADYICKPFLIQELESKLKYFLSYEHC
ncbi:response regulator receiver protein [Chondrocystis sp. NIES-4102]|nr:response regulator receiver protein [Chondrocystis sp. NIES-4102]